MVKHVILLLLFFQSIVPSSIQEQVTGSYHYTYDDNGLPVDLHLQADCMIGLVMNECLIRTDESYHQNSLYAIANGKKLLQLQSSHVVCNQLHSDAQGSLGFTQQLQDRSDAFCRMKGRNEGAFFESTASSGNYMPLGYTYAQLLQLDHECLQRYNMHYNLYDKILSQSHDDFQRSLLSIEQLSDEQVYGLLQDYLDRCYFPNRSKYQKLQQAIEDTIAQRKIERETRVKQKLQQEVERQKQLAQQELQAKYGEKLEERLIEKQIKHQSFLAGQHDILANPYWLEQSLDDQVIEAREQAYEKSHDDHFEQYGQTYDLDAVTQGFCQAKQIRYIDFLHCYGTALQQQYHHEICDTLTRAAHHHLNCSSHTLLREHATNFVQAAHEANSHDHVASSGALSTIAMTFMDICADLLSRPLVYGQAVLHGAAESAYDTACMLARPDKTICNLGKMIYFVVETSVLCECAVEYPDTQVAQTCRDRIDSITQGFYDLKEQLAQADGPQRVQMMTKFACDFALPEKMVHATGTLFAGVAGQAKGMKAMEGVVGMMDEALAAEHMVEVACQAESAVQAGMQESALAQFMSAENTASKFNSRSNVSLSHLVKEARSVIKNGVIPFEHEKLVADLKGALQRLQDRLKCSGYDQMKQKYYKRVIIKDGKKHDIKNIALDHTGLFEFKFERKRKQGGIKFEISGGHVAGTWQMLEREGLVTLDIVEKLDNGCIKYIGKENIMGSKVIKTEFPVSWSQEKIFEAGWQIYDQGIEYMTAKEGIGKKMVLHHLEVSIPIKQYEEATNIKNILPYYMEEKK